MVGCSNDDLLQNPAENHTTKTTSPLDEVKKRLPILRQMLSAVTRSEGDELEIKDYVEIPIPVIINSGDSTGTGDIDPGTEMVGGNVMAVACTFKDGGFAVFGTDEIMPDVLMFVPRPTDPAMVSVIDSIFADMFNQIEHDMGQIKLHGLPKLMYETLSTAEIKLNADGVPFQFCVGLSEPTFSTPYDIDGICRVKWNNKGLYNALLPERESGIHYSSSATAAMAARLMATIQQPESRL